MTTRLKVLLALDDSTCAETAMRAVLRQFTPATHEIRVFQAVDWEPRLPISYQFASGPGAAASVFTARDEMVRQSKSYVDKMAERLRAAGFVVTTEVKAEGTACDAILYEAERWHADLIVVGSHGRSGINRLLLGSVSEGVARGAHCSVQIARALSA